MNNSAVSNEEKFKKIQCLVKDWLEKSGGTRLDVDYNALGRSGDVHYWLTIDGERKATRMGDAACFAVDDLRGMQVLPGRGAWFYSHLWMELPEGVLHQESDWMCEPNLGDSYFFATSDGLDIRPGGPDLGEYKTEIDWFPRDQEFIPDWLRDKLERWRVEHGPAVAKRVAQLEVEFRLKDRTFRYP